MEKLGSNTVTLQLISEKHIDHQIFGIEIMIIIFAIMQALSFIYLVNLLDKKWKE